MVPIYITLFICAIFAGLLVYRYDLYEREPWWMIALAVLGGAGVMVFCGWWEDLTLDWIGHRTFEPRTIAIVAATHEELARFVIVVLLAFIFNRQVNDPMDGIIYGSMAGLGMAVNESLFYLDLIPPKGDSLPPSELVRLTGHLVMGGIGGFGVGVAVMRNRRAVWVVPGCLLLAIGLHFMWDWIAFDCLRGAGRTPVHIIGAISVMLFGLLFYGMLVVVGSDWSRRVFAPHSTKVLWGWPVTVMLELVRGKKEHDPV